MEEKVFDSYAEYNKFSEAVCEAIFNNGDMTPFKCKIRLTDKAKEEMERSGDYYTLEEFTRELNRRIDAHMKKADERIRIHESQKEE